MKRVDERLRYQQGMVLMSSLAILFVMMVVGIGVGTMLQNDYLVLANLRRSTEAFYFSAAGLEWSKSEIARASNFPPLPENQSRKFSTGEFAVSYSSSSLTGPFAARIVVRSVGTNRVSQHVLQAQLTKAFDLSDAALALRGNGSRVRFGSDAILISGADHDPSDGSLVSGSKARSSVSISDDTLRGLVQQALGDPLRAVMLDSSSGAQAPTTSSYLPSAFVTQLAGQLCASAAATVHVIPNDGNLTIENQTWGSQAAPQLHCVDGLLASGDAVSLAGVTGAGILVVRDAGLILTGAFRWDGLVIVTGSGVGLQTTGSSNKDLCGAVVINESGTPEENRALLDLDGHIRILFSRKALRRVMPLVPTISLDSAYAALPFVVVQDYWRTVTP